MTTRLSSYSKGKLKRVQGLQRERVCVCVCVCVCGRGGCYFLALENAQWNMMSWAFLPAPTFPPSSKMLGIFIGLSLSTAEEVQLDTSFITMLSLLTPLLQAHFLFLSVLWPVVLLFPGGNLDLQKNYQISWSSSQSNSNKSQEQVQFLSSPSPLLVPPVPHDGRRLLFHYQEISFCLLWESGFFACS